MEIIWVRHFMTPGNRKKQYIGSTDEPLDEEMIPQDLKNYPQIDAPVSYTHLTLPTKA